MHSLQAAASQEAGISVLPSLMKCSEPEDSHKSACSGEDALKADLVITSAVTAYMKAARGNSPNSSKRWHLCSYSSKLDETNAMRPQNLVVWTFQTGTLNCQLDGPVREKRASSH